MNIANNGDVFFKDQDEAYVLNKRKTNEFWLFKDSGDHDKSDEKLILIFEPNGSIRNFDGRVGNLIAEGNIFAFYENPNRARHELLAKSVNQAVVDTAILYLRSTKQQEAPMKK